MVRVHVYESIVKGDPAILASGSSRIVSMCLVQELRGLGLRCFGLQWQWQTICRLTERDERN